MYTWRKIGNAYVHHQHNGNPHMNRMISLCVLLLLSVAVCTFLREIKTAEKSRGDIFSVYLLSLYVRWIFFYHAFVLCVWY